MKENKPNGPPLIGASRLPNSHPRFHLRNDKVYDWRYGRFLEARELVDLLNEFNNLASGVAKLNEDEHEV